MDGKLVEINKYNFSNDVIYYEKIMNIKKGFITKKISSKVSNTNSVISKFLHIPIHL
jgi:hypothetical protein